MNREGQEPEAPDSSVVVLARFTGHGLTIAAATGLFLLAGWWVDGRLGTTPLLTIVGALVGAGAGFYSMLQHLLLRPGAEEGRTASRTPEDPGSRAEGDVERGGGHDGNGPGPPASGGEGR